MNVGVGAMRLGLARALIVVCLLAGVFAIHGLTSQHDAAMALRHTIGGETTTGTTHHADASTVMVDGAHSLPEISAVVIAAQREAGHDRLTDLCLAVLTALALAFRTVIACLRRRVVPVYDGRSRLARVRSPSRPPPCGQPSLSKLCVLRT